MSETICLDTKKGQKEIGVTIDRVNYKGDRVEVSFTYKSPDNVDIIKSFILTDKGDTVEIVADTPDNYARIEV